MTLGGENTKRAPSAAFGKYELFAKLGSGGMAEVFLALSRGMAGFNKLVVLKRLRPSVAEDTAMISMFLDEARLAARLHHPNIVNTYEVGEHEGAYFIAMELLEGQPVNRILKSEKARALLTPTMWCHVFAQALAGLHHAHEQKDYDGNPLDIVHRDLSPHNIFVTYAGEAKLVDFGIAKASVNTTNTATGILKGKVNYMAPEQIRGDIDRRADIFAIGLTFWEALTGRGVFRGEAVTVLHRILNDPLPKPTEVVPDLDPKLEAIVMKAIEKDKSARYQTAEEFREAIDGYLRETQAVVRDSDVGKILSTVFAETKANVDARIKECVASLSATPRLSITGESSTGNSTITSLTGTTGSLPSLALTAQTSEFPVLGEHSDPALSGSGGSGSGSGSGARSSQGKVDGTSALPPPLDMQASVPPAREKNALPWVFVGILLIVIVGGAATYAMKRPSTGGTANDTPGSTRTQVSVSLDSQPSGASIERDGQVIGHTPATLDLPVGKHVLTLGHEGFAPTEVTVDALDPQKPLARSVILKPADAVAATTGSPSASASSSAHPKPGTATAYVPPKGVPTTGHAVVPTPGTAPTPTQPPAPSATAASSPGFLSFTTFPWTRVSEGGRTLGTTPLYKVPLPPGTHVLSLDNPDDNIHTTYTVTIKSGEAASRSLELK
jgi:serine/threonine-protein kinase